jgi:hypothetical protein
MKTLVFIAMLLTVMIANTFAQAEKTFVRTIELDEDAPVVELVTTNEVEVVRWNEGTVRIVTNVNTPYITERELQAIAKVGRYTWEVEFHEEENLLLLELPNLEKIIKINEIDLEEEIDIILYLPTEVDYRIINPFELNLM